MNPTDFINNYLTKVRDKDGLKNIDFSFIYAYGPYMCMNPGFERECDEIARYNTTMKMLVHGAYLIRKIMSGISHREAKIVIKNFILSVDNQFQANAGVDEYRMTLMNFAANYLSTIRAEQHKNGEFESFMTSAAPVIPYSQMVEKKGIEESCQGTCASSILEYCNHPTEMQIDDILKKILLRNFEGILMNATAYTEVITDAQTYQNDLTKLDKILYEFKDLSDEINVYYYLAIVDFLKIPFEVLKRHLTFLKDAGDFSKTQSYPAFESMVNLMAQYTNIDICAESWDDPTMDRKEELAIAEIMKHHDLSKSGFKEEPAKYNFGALNDFINVNRFIKFEEFPNRVFVSSVERATIINVNIMGANRNYYEMSNDTVACPFLDLRDYQMKVIVLYGGTNEIQIYDDLHDIY